MWWTLRPVLWQQIRDRFTMVDPSLDSFSLIDASSTAGDDFLMLETPKSSNEQLDAPAEHKTADFNWARWAWTWRRTWMPSCNSVARLGTGTPATLEAASGTQTSPIPAAAPGTDTVCTASRLCKATKDGVKVV